MQMLSVRVEAMRPFLTRKQPEIEMGERKVAPILPPEIVEKILKGADARMLVKARTFGRSWVKIVDKKFQNFKIIYLDVMGIELFGTKLSIQLEAEPFKFAYILPLLRWFDFAPTRSITVIHLKDKFKNDKSAKWYYYRLSLSCDLSDLAELTAMMENFPVRIFCLQAVKKWEGRYHIPLTLEMMDLLEKLFKHWKIMHSSVCLDRTQFDQRFNNLLHRTQMHSAYKCNWSQWNCQHPLRFRTMPYTKSERLCHGVPAAWLARVSKKSTLLKGKKEAYRVEFGGELRSLVIPRVERGNDYNVFKTTVSSPELYLEKSIEAMRDCEIHPWQKRKFRSFKWYIVTTSILKVVVILIGVTLLWYGVMQVIRVMQCAHGLAECGDEPPPKTHHMKIAEY